MTFVTSGGIQGDPGLILLGLMEERDRLAATVAPGERQSFGTDDEKVIANLLKRLRGEE